MSGSTFSLTLAAIIVPMLAQSELMVPPWAQPLLNVGPMGAVLIWFMFRNEKKMRFLTSAVDRLNRASMLMVITSKRSGDGEKALANDIMKEIDEAHKNE